MDLPESIPVIIAYVASSRRASSTTVSDSSPNAHLSFEIIHRCRGWNAMTM